MENFPSNITDVVEASYKKIYYAEIIQDIYEGNSFAFDETSYNRFYPIAQLNGYDFGPEDFSTDFSNNYEKKICNFKNRTKSKIIT